MDKLKNLCAKFLDSRYYFEYYDCGNSSTGTKVFDVFLQYKEGTKYRFGVLQMNCEKDLVKSFSITESESYDMVRDWVKINVEGIKERITGSDPNLLANAC